MLVDPAPLATPVLRHKHIRIDQAKLDKAKRIFSVPTDTEALDRALALAVGEAEIDVVLRRWRGRGKLRKVFLRRDLW